MERCNVISKNLAIASAKTGKLKNEIDNIMKPVTKKIEGYDYGSFEGWYEKAVKGELSEYNVYELNKWGEMYIGTKFYGLDTITLSDADIEDEIRIKSFRRDKKLQSCRNRISMQDCHAKVCI